MMEYMNIPIKGEMPVRLFIPYIMIDARTYQVPQSILTIVTDMLREYNVTEWTVELNLAPNSIETLIVPQVIRWPLVTILQSLANQYGYALRIDHMRHVIIFSDDISQ